MTRDGSANRLATQASPYLLQHAHNPVDWYPWGEEALARAAAEDKPLLVSIGYAACHWCHVMERESFEDPDTAALMNEHFVSVKVDREERPDVDAIYMDAAQAMTGHGGWPLTAFCAPDGVPFFAGTYFPPEPRAGMPSFRQVLTGIAQAWTHQRPELLAQGRKVLDAIGAAGAVAASEGPLDGAILRRATRALREGWDEVWGGIGHAPKFPQPMVLEFLLRMHLRGEAVALPIVRSTLDRMAMGGIYDQLGGGFARYSVDERWQVPHFEKMLYDNAQLARVYVHAWQITADPRYRRVAVETLEYLLREMQHAEGAFFSSQDADSEGIEGRFFVWTWDELVALVGEDVAALFGASPEGNWAPEGRSDGTNVLWLPAEPAAVAADRHLDADDLTQRLEDAREELFEVRRGRVHPGTDDKVLSAWNGLAISAFAEAGRALGEPAYVDAAVRAADFVLRHLREDSGRLLRSWRNGVPGVPGYVDDHAIMAEACLTLYETTFELRWFVAARELCDELLRLFLDPERGGFFTTGSDADELVLRPKELFDNAVPAGNSVAANVLQRMALLTGDPRYEDAGLSALRLVGDAMGRAPTGFGEALSALDLHVGPAPEIAIIGDPAAAETRALAGVVLTGTHPNRVLAVSAPWDHESAATVPLLEGRVQRDGATTAYVCERFACTLPVTTPEELAAQLAGLDAAGAVE